MDCVALYLRYCAFDVWYYMLLVFGAGVTFWFWERGIRPIPRKGWFGNFLFGTCALCLAIFAFDWVVGCRQRGPLSQRIERCVAEHAQDFEDACSLSSATARE